VQQRRGRAHKQVGRPGPVTACEICSTGEAYSNVLYLPRSTGVVSAMLELHRDDDADPAHRYDSWPSALACARCTERIGALPPIAEHTAIAALSMTSRRWVLHLRSELGYRAPAGAGLAHPAPAADLPPPRRTR
jgi:hypothetical protein